MPVFTFRSVLGMFYKAVLGMFYKAVLGMFYKAPVYGHNQSNSKLSRG